LLHCYEGGLGEGKVGEGRGGGICPMQDPPMLSPAPAGEYHVAFIQLCMHTAYII